MLLTYDEAFFLTERVRELKKDNEEMGGLLFPFLFCEKRLLRAKMIKTRKPPYVCFACLTMQNKYNGIWLPVDENELHEQTNGLVSIEYRRVKAQMVFDVVVPMDGSLCEVEFNIAPEESSLLTFFDYNGAMHVSYRIWLDTRS